MVHAITPASAGLRTDSLLFLNRLTIHCAIAILMGTLACAEAVDLRTTVTVLLSPRRSGTFNVYSVILN